MPRFSGKQYKGALADYRRELRFEAQQRQAAEKARAEARKPTVIWRSRAARARKGRG